MKTCNGAPAERFALAYVEGTLSKSESECFEEHYFDCPVCLEYLEALEAVESQLERNPVKVVSLPVRQVSAGRRWIWRLAGAAAAIAIGLVGFKVMQHPVAPPVLTARTPLLAQASVAPKPMEKARSVTAERLVDLTAPAYAAINLRGEYRDKSMISGMEAYQKSRYGEAVADLAQVPEKSLDGPAARFYMGASQMLQNQLDQASATFSSIAEAGDSPEQEGALYYLAQIALRRNQVAQARMYLSRTEALHGDFEVRARQQLRKLKEPAAVETAPATGR
jgi:tetratricopeptide (TPR) repeat protein